MRNAGLNDNNVSIITYCRTISDLGHADTTQIAETKEDLEELVRNLRKVNKQAGVLLSIQKETKVMMTAENDNFEVNGEYIEVVKKFHFLGCILNRNLDHTKEIKRRLMLDRNAMANCATITKDKNILLNTEKRRTKALVFPDFMHRSKTCIIKRVTMKKS